MACALTASVNCAISARAAASCQSRCAPGRPDLRTAERDADVALGEIFRALLAERRAELCDILDQQAVRLARYERVPDGAGVRQKRRKIRRSAQRSATSTA
jgi:hypothetical protein